MDVLDPTAFTEVAVPVAAVASLTLYLAIQLLIILYSSHRYLVLWRWWRVRRSLPSPKCISPDPRPRVTIQLPVFNEPEVIERLIDAIAAFDYPRDRLEIQVLDDSTDRTTDLARAAAERHCARGVDVTVHHRDARHGFKAGALAEGLRTARAVNSSQCSTPTSCHRRTFSQECCRTSRDLMSAWCRRAGGT